MDAGVVAVRLGAIFGRDEGTLLHAVPVGQLLVVYEARGRRTILVVAVLVVDMFAPGFDGFADAKQKEGQPERDEQRCHGHGMSPRVVPGV